MPGRRPGANGPAAPFVDASRPHTRFYGRRHGKTVAVSGGGTGLRARIRRAIQEPVDRSAKLLDELQDGDDHTKLSILISGWGRGLAAGLEELAVAVEEHQGKPTTSGSASPRRADLAGADEEQLLDEARRSLDETAEAREELESSHE